MRMSPRNRLWHWLLGMMVLLLEGGVPAFAGEEVGPLVARIRAVGREGAGNEEAARAWRELVQRGPGALPDILAALDEADPTAANWLRAAFDAAAEQALAAGRALPAARLEAFVREKRHVGRARR